MNFPFGLTRKVTKVNLDDLRASAERVFATHTLPNVTAFIDDSMGATPVLCVTEDERSHSTPIGDVARRIERSRPAEPGDPLTAGIIEWLRHRPITDAQARATGVAALG